MAHLQLQAKTRTKIGHTAKQLAREGQLPAVVYSDKVKSTPISIDYKEFYHTYKVAGKTNVIDLKIDEGKSIPVIVHDLDIHPFKDIPRHIDFLAVNLKKEITTVVPVEIEGEAPAIKEFGAIVNIVHNELNVTALPDKLPESITVNVDELKEMSDHITIADLANKAGDYKFADEAETVVVSLAMPKEEVEEEITSEVAEGEEGAEGAEAATEETKE